MIQLLLGGLFPVASSVVPGLREPWRVEAKRKDPPLNDLFKENIVEKLKYISRIWKCKLYIIRKSLIISFGKMILFISL